MKHKRLTALVLAAALVLAGCGGTKSSSGSAAASQSTGSSQNAPAIAVQKERITEQFTLEKTVRSEWGSAQKLTIHVPQLVCDSPDAESINDELAPLTAEWNSPQQVDSTGSFSLGEGEDWCWLDLNSGGGCQLATHNNRYFYQGAVTYLGATPDGTALGFSLVRDTENGPEWVAFSAALKLDYSIDCLILTPPERAEPLDERNGPAGADPQLRLINEQEVQDETPGTVRRTGGFAGGAAGRLRGKDRSLCPPGWQPGTEIDPAGFHARHRGDHRAVHS